MTTQYARSETDKARHGPNPGRRAGAPAAALIAAILFDFGLGPAFAQQEPAAVVGMEAVEFPPATVTGETVRWDNTSDTVHTVHTVTADVEQAATPASVSLPEGAEPFASGFMQPGDSFSHTFEVAGSYTYFCIPHERAGMIAHVVVE